MYVNIERQVGIMIRLNARDPGSKKGISRRIAATFKEVLVGK
jgi:hypothetical protein